MQSDWSIIVERKPQGYVELNDGKVALYGPIQNVSIDDNDKEYQLFSHSDFLLLFQSFQRTFQNKFFQLFVIAIFVNLAKRVNIFFF